MEDLAADATREDHPSRIRTADGTFVIRYKLEGKKENEELTKRRIKQNYPNKIHPIGLHDRFCMGERVRADMQ